MIIVADINAIWRRRPFEALGREISVLGLAPADPLVAWRQHRWPLRKIPEVRQGRFFSLPVVMPPGWASRGIATALPQLWKKAVAGCEAHDEQPKALIVTSPHYLPLVATARNEVPCYYYCSDDYHSYAGWGGDEMREKEMAMVAQVEHAFFVSQPLADRAVADYGVPAAKVSVSMNAADEGFLQPVDEAQIQKLFAAHPHLRRPVVGIVGGVNDRLDFDLLYACVRRLELGTLLFVGQVEDLRCPALAQLRLQSKCLFVGRQPHAELPTWLQLLDVALIPYRHTEFNRHCSPMRLFDHLASGRPIVSTDGCPQVLAIQPWVQVAAETREVLEILAGLLKRGPLSRSAEMVSYARQHTWPARAQFLRGKVFGAQTI